MAKRFTDTNKWKKDFIRGLQGAYKLLWMYILDECDHAGIWHVEIDIAKIRIGEDINEKEAIKQFEDKIIVVDNGKKWFIQDFIDFQYGELNPENRVHKSIIGLLNKYNIKGLKRSLQGSKDMDMDMDMDNIPTREEFVNYAKEQKPNIDVEAVKLKYNSWIENNWITSGKKPHKIKNWKSTLLNTLPHIKENEDDMSEFNKKIKEAKYG